MKIISLLPLSAATALATPSPRALPIYAKAWAGSSVNVLTNQSSTLITDGNFQYAAFYAANTHLVLARRALNKDKGETRQGARRGYLAAAIDPAGTLHLAWNWRESSDVATNHDLCYAKSSDGGQTWTTSNGTTLTLPITSATAEYALKIPQNSTLMNPPSLTTDAAGHPFIGT